jgi:hypothetical protein
LLESIRMQLCAVLILILSCGAVRYCEAQTSTKYWFCRGVVSIAHGNGLGEPHDVLTYPVPFTSDESSLVVQKKLADWTRANYADLLEPPVAPNGEAHCDGPYSAEVAQKSMDVSLEVYKKQNNQKFSKGYYIIKVVHWKPDQVTKDPQDQ